MFDSLEMSRRRMFRFGLYAISAAGVAMGLSPRRVKAQDLPQLSEDDATAKELQYVHDGTASARTDASQECANCTYYKGGAGDAWARCDLFPGKVVNGKGWCKVWTAKS